MYKLFLSVLVGFALLMGQPLRAQKAGNAWYFGNHAGLDFSLSYPKPVAHGMTNSAEGVASISDASGNLLFYTDGQTVYDRNHNIMQNGNRLNGSNLSSQSSLIVPKPGSDTEYYLFTVDKAVSSLTSSYNGLCYSVIDLTGNASLGAVTEQKNIQLPSSANILFTEKITAVKRADGNYWILVHEFGTWQFYEYLLTSNGVSYVNQIGAGSEYKIDLTDLWNTRATGYFKASPDGNMLVTAIQGYKKFELFNFNKESGSITQFATLNAGNLTNTQQPFGAAYGIEFSPTGRFLYGSSKTGGLLYQWDVSSRDQTTILKSVQILQNDPSIPVGALQLAPNDKIYVAIDNKPYLGVIKAPDFDSCDYVAQGASLVDTLASQTGLSGYGLPNFPSNIFQDSIYYAHDCVNDSTIFYLSSTDIVEPYWFINGQQVTFEPTQVFKYVFRAPGTYTIKMEGARNGRVTLSRTITIHPLPELNIDDTTYLCAGQPVTLHDGKYAFYGIFDKDGLYTDGARTIDQVGKYRVTVTNFEGCTRIDTTTAVSTNSVRIDTIMVNPVSCAGIDDGSITIQMTGTNRGYTFTWKDISDDTNYRDHLKAGEYSVSINTVNGGCQLDTTITVPTEPFKVAINRKGNDTGPVCPHTRVELIATGAEAYIWNNDPSQNQNTFLINPDTTTVITVTGSKGGVCFDTDSIKIVVYPAHPLDLGGDLTPCVGDYVVIRRKDYDPDHRYTTFSWSTGSAADSLVIQQDFQGMLSLTVTDGNQCTSSDSIAVHFQPAIDLHIDRLPISPDSVCPGQPVTLTATGAAHYYWAHDPGKDQSAITVYPSTTTTYRVTGTNGGTCLVTDSITIVVHEVIKPDLGDDVFRCQGDTLVLRRKDYDPDARFSGWSWSTGATTDSLVVTQSVAGLVLTVTDPHGCTATDTVNITFNPQPVVNSIRTRDISCNGSADGSLTIHIDDPGAYHYSIDAGQTWSDQPDFNPLPVGQYIVIISSKDIYGLHCLSLPDTVQITEPDSLKASIRSVSPTCPECTDGEIRIGITGGNKPYVIECDGFTLRDTLFTDIGAGTYHFTITDANGCELQIEYALVASELFIPNAFSPNGGTRNEKWMIRVIENRKNSRVQVYDRSGKLVYYSDGVYDPWDGTYLNQGKKLPAGTYFYRIQIDQTDTNKPPQLGTVTILR